METKHTPSPWETQSEREGNEVYGRIVGMSITAGGNRSICRVHGFNATESCIQEEAKANAQLIAAAPELLESAKAALKLLDEMMRGHDEGHTAEWLRAAISKATGTK